MFRQYIRIEHPIHVNVEDYLRLAQPPIKSYVDDWRGKKISFDILGIVEGEVKK